MRAEKKDLLQEFEGRKAKIVSFAERLRLLAIERGDTETAQILDGFMRRFRETRFLALVVGDFKSGKSSFVNALIGRTICPVKATPRTAKITRLTAAPGGEAEHAVIHYREDRAPERVPLETVPLDDLVAHKGSRTEGVKHVDLFLKPDGTVLRHPLTLVDTPGLGSGEEAHSRVTRDYMQHADAVVFVFSASKPFSETERDFLLSFRALLPRTIFVVNQADRVPVEEQQDVLEHIRTSLRENVLGAGASVPPLLLVSSRDAMGAQRAGDADALASSGLVELTSTLERKLADDHGTPLLQGIAAKQRDVCAGLIHQASLSKDALSADSDVRASFEARRTTLREERDTLRAEKARINQRISALRADVLERGAKEADAVDAALLKDATRWILKECASESDCKRDLPGVLSKLLADHTEAFDGRLRATYGHVADKACERVGEVLGRMEERIRDILAPGERNGMRNDDELRKAAAGLTGLDAVASGVGGPTGGYGVARHVLNTAFAPSVAARVLSVATAVGILIGTVSGVGWIVAGIAGLLAAVFGISHSSSWRVRVANQVSERLHADVFPKVVEQAEISVNAFFDSLRDEVMQHMDSVHAQLEAIVERVARDYRREEAQRKVELGAIDAFLGRARALLSEIDSLVVELPSTPAAPSIAPQLLLPPSGAAA